MHSAVMKKLDITEKREEYLKRLAFDLLQSGGGETSDYFIKEVELMDDLSMREKLVIMMFIGFRFN